ncbi:hypothetical protein FA13DRAFT_1727170, partial [Coprinellus micaceus]
MHPPVPGFRLFGVSDLSTRPWIPKPKLKNSTEFVSMDRTLPGSSPGVTLRCHCHALASAISPGRFLGVDFWIWCP